MSTRKRRGGGKRRRSQFIDVVFDGYIRDMALTKWREIDDLASVNGLTPQAAVEEAGVFPVRGSYAGVWSRVWGEHFNAENPVAATTPEAIFMRIEGAVREALTEEQAQRKARGEGDLEDTLHYKAFIDRAMENLLEDAHGEIEADNAFDELGDD